MSVEVLKDIRKELAELRLLYKELVEKLVPTEQPTLEERKAIEDKDEVVNEKELMKTLGKTNVRQRLKGKPSEKSQNSPKNKN
jgi:hypothetical protein